MLCVCESEHTCHSAYVEVGGLLAGVGSASLLPFGFSELSSDCVRCGNKCLFPISYLADPITFVSVRKCLLHLLLRRNAYA